MVIFVDADSTSGNSASKQTTDEPLGKVLELS